MNDVDSTLNERGARYGNYSDVAGTTQQLMAFTAMQAAQKNVLKPRKYFVMFTAMQAAQKKRNDSWCCY